MDGEVASCECKTPLRSILSSVLAYLGRAGASYHAHRRQLEVEDIRKGMASSGRSLSAVFGQDKKDLTFTREPGLAMHMPW